MKTRLQTEQYISNITDENTFTKLNSISAILLMRSVILLMRTRLQNVYKRLQN